MAGIFIVQTTLLLQTFDFILNLYTQSAIVEQFQLSQKCQARWNFTDYQRAFQHVQDYIVAGDCYQINLTQEFSAEAQGPLLADCSSVLATDQCTLCRLFTYW